MFLLSEGNFIAFYIFIISFVTSSGRKNWQHIDVYMHSLIPKFLLVEEDSSANIYCGSYFPAMNWTYMNISLGWDHFEYQPVLSKHCKGWKQLRLNDLTEGDSGVYTCRGRDNGQFFELHSLVTVIRKHVGVLHYLQYHGSISPNWIEVSKNSTVTLTCYSSNPVEWYGVHLNSQNKYISEYTLTLFNLKGQHSGEYICRGFYADIRTQIFHSTSRIFHATSRIIVDGIVTRKNESLYF